jgi:hypothetical protein
MNQMTGGRIIALTNLQTLRFGSIHSTYLEDYYEKNGKDI